MSREEFRNTRVDAASLGGMGDRSVAILAVGETREWLERRNTLPMEGGVFFASIDDVTEGLMDRVCPNVVISPALSQRFDCIDLAQRLHAFGYSGRYRAITRDLPNPAMIEREIRDLCPGLDFAILLAH